MGMRIQKRVDLTYGLSTRGSEALEKTWFFDLPTQHDHQEAWTELLHRIFYDANLKMTRREPGDQAFLFLRDFRVAPVDAATMLAWDGTTTREATAVHNPWIRSAHQVVWEFTACYFVDETGAYDGMEGEDFAELTLYRALADGRATEVTARAFLDRLYPGHGSAIFADRLARLRNLLGVRATREFRRPPGSRPWRSGPVQPEDLAAPTP